MPLRVGRPSLRKSCAVLGVKLPTNGTWHNALYDAELAGLLHFRLKEIENKGCKVRLGLAPHDPPRLVQCPTVASAPSSHPVQPFSRGMRVWYRDACDEIVAATIKDVLPPSSRLKYDIQTDAGERIDTNNIRQWSEVPPTAETWESTQATKPVTHVAKDLPTPLPSPLPSPPSTTPPIAVQLTDTELTLAAAVQELEQMKQSLEHEKQSLAAKKQSLAASRICRCWWRLKIRRNEARMQQLQDESRLDCAASIIQSHWRSRVRVSGGREAPDPPLDGAFIASEELRESGGLGRELIDGEEAVAQVALSIVQGNAFVNAQSMHSTSIHQGLRADSVAQPDYDMASASDSESEDEVPVDSPPALLKVRIAICRMPCPSEMRRRFFDSMYNWDTYLDFGTNFHDMADSLAQIFNDRLARSDQDSDNELDQIMGPYLPTEDPRYSGYFMSAPTYQDLLAVIQDKCSESQVPHVRLLGADPQGVASFARVRYRRLQYALHQAVLEDEAKKLVEKCNSEFKKLDRKIVLPATWNAGVEALNSAWKVYNDLRFAPARIEFEIREIGGVEARRVRLRGIFRLLRHIIIMVMLWKARMLERLYAPGGGAALAAQVRFERRAAIMDSLGSS